MWRKVAFLMVLLMGTVSIVGGQTSTKIDARALLIELGNMLTEIPESKEDCQALFERIKAWQEAKLKELEAPKVELSIVEPKDGTKVPERPYIKGIVADPNAEVWVIVHPMEVADYWVQPRVSVRRDGTWKVNIYIGRPGRIDVGKHFEIRAVANPKAKLSRGDILRGWPEAKWSSEVIEVTRK